mmetsp:Transcript_27685/g.48217  ORF Transcript_27685/g.48217 Transcript_27685/m.48217 type:complete len:261 (-) Transcript_27685:12-794(-)
MCLADFLVHHRQILAQLLHFLDLDFHHRRQLTRAFDLLLNLVVSHTTPHQHQGPLPIVFDLARLLFEVLQHVHASFQLLGDVIFLGDEGELEHFDLRRAPVFESVCDPRARSATLNIAVDRLAIVGDHVHRCSSERCSSVVAADRSNVVVEKRLDEERVQPLGHVVVHAQQRLHFRVPLAQGSGNDVLHKLVSHDAALDLGRRGYHLARRGSDLTHAPLVALGAFRLDRVLRQPCQLIQQPPCVAHLLEHALSLFLNLVG